MSERESDRAAVGYLIVEDRQTDLDALAAQEKTLAIALPLLEFLAREANRRLETDEVSVMAVEYHGRYPALVIRGDGHLTEEQVQAETDRILSEVPLSTFVRFLKENPLDWKAAVTSLLARPER